jgi:hypothetical protein
MLEKIPGAYINLDNGEASSPVHNDRYDFHDEAIRYGAAMFALLVERTLVSRFQSPGVGVSLESPCRYCRRPCLLKSHYHLGPGYGRPKLTLRLATANYLERPLSCGSRPPQIGGQNLPRGHRPSLTHRPYRFRDLESARVGPEQRNDVE